MMMEDIDYARNAARDFERYAKVATFEDSDREYCIAQAAWAKRQMQLKPQRKPQRIKIPRHTIHGVGCQADCTNRPWRVNGPVNGRWQYVGCYKSMQEARDVATALWLKAYGFAPVWKY